MSNQPVSAPQPRKRDGKFGAKAVPEADLGANGLFADPSAVASAPDAARPTPPKPDAVAALLAQKARESRQRFEDDMVRVATTYRSAADFRDPDYIGTANLSYTAYQVAEQVDLDTGDNSLAIVVEDLCEILEKDPSDRAARDRCAAIVTGYYASSSARRTDPSRG